MLCIKVENSVSFPDTENAQKKIMISNAEYDIEKVEIMDKKKIA